MSPADMAGSAFTVGVDGAALEVRLAPDLDHGLRSAIVRSLTGYDTSDGPSQAWVAVEGTAPVTVSSGFTGAAPPPDPADSVPYADPLQVELAEYVVYAVAEWVDAASMLLGHHGTARVHAAGFVDGGHTWVVTGSSNAGKTSLALDAVSRGAAYLTEERITVRSGGDHVEVAGLAQPLRIRGELGERSDLARRLLLPGSGSDAFRQLVFCDQLGALGGVERGWVRPTDLLVLTDDPPATVGRGWVVRQLVEQCMNAITLGPDAILDLARLVCATRIHVARARTVASVRDLGDAALQPLEVLPDLLPSRHDQESGPGGDTPVQVQVGVRTVVLGTECAVWIPGDPPTVIHLEGSGAEWWSALQHGDDVPTGGGFAGFVSELQQCGALAG